MKAVKIISMSPSKVQAEIIAQDDDGTLVTKHVHKAGPGWLYASMTQKRKILMTSPVEGMGNLL